MALGLLLAAVVLVVAIINIGQASRQPVPPAETETTPHQSEDVSYHWLGDSWAQWLMAGFALVATGVSWRALYLLRETFKETKRTADATGIDLRPWVDIKVVAGALAIRDGRVVGEVEVVAKNIGRTPAIGCQIRCELIYMSGGTLNLGYLTDEFYNGDLRRMGDAYAGVNMLPGNESSRVIVTASDPVEITEIDLNNLYIAACVTYRHSAASIGQTGVVFRAEGRPANHIHAIAHFYPSGRQQWTDHFLGYESGGGCGRVT